MKIEEIKKRIKEYQNYVEIYENYKAKTMKQMAIKLYAELNNVNEVAKQLNEKGFRKDGKLVAGERARVKLISNDVTKMLNSDVDEGDLLHPEVKRILNRNRRRKGIVF